MRTQLAPASAGTRLKKFLRACLAVAFAVALSSAFDGWLASVAYALCAAVALVLFHGAWRGEVAPCPSCRAPLGASSDQEHVLQKSDEPVSLRCERCGEYLTVLQGEVWLHEPIVADAPSFKSRVYPDGVWPDGCVLCGDNVTRREDLGQVKGVPYCGAHSRAVVLQRVDDTLMLEWRSLPMLRKYLAANRPPR